MVDKLRNPTIRRN